MKHDDEIRYITSIRQIMARFWSQYTIILVHSFFISLLALTPFLYLRQIFDRVYLSRSWDTLAFLTLIFVILLVVWSLLTMFRDSALRAIGSQVDADLRWRVFDAIHTHPKTNALRYLGDVRTLREGLTGPFISSLFDALLTPVFVLVLFLLHPVFGWFSIAYVLIVVVFTIMSRRIWIGVRTNVSKLEDEALNFGVATSRKAATILSMNLLPGVRDKWAQVQFRASEMLLDGKEASGRVESVVKFLRRGEMVFIIGIGAILYLLNQIDQPTAFAAFIVMTRGIAPILSVATNWQTVGEVQASADNIGKLLAEMTDKPRTPLVSVQGAMSCENVSFLGTQGQVILKGISFELKPGECLGIIGPSGAGKSTLLRLLAGAPLEHAGDIKVDGFSLRSIPLAQIGDARGYLPQEVDLFPGTIWENIARYRPFSEEENKRVFAATQMAGAVGLIQNLKDGFDTDLQIDGFPLSGGQRQRIGLARTFFGDPKLVILDEPNSALDSKGEQDLMRAFEHLKEKKTTVIFTTHKADLLSACDHVLVLMDGYVHSYSTRDDILRRLASSDQKQLIGRRDD